MGLQNHSAQLTIAWAALSRPASARSATQMPSTCDAAGVRHVDYRWGSCSCGSLTCLTPASSEVDGICWALRADAGLGNAAQATHAAAAHAGMMLKCQDAVEDVDSAQQVRPSTTNSIFVQLLLGIHDNTQSCSMAQCTETQ